jgi:hypothetical protein
LCPAVWPLESTMRLLVVMEVVVPLPAQFGGLAALDQVLSFRQCFRRWNDIRGFLGRHAAGPESRMDASNGTFTSTPDLG